jgi:hypothetical protein
MGFVGWLADLGDCLILPNGRSVQPAPKSRFAAFEPLMSESKINSESRSKNIRIPQSL